MFIKVKKNYLGPYFTAEDCRFHVRGPPANYVYGCHVTPVTRGALVYTSCQKGIIQWYPGHRYAPREAFGLCSRIVFRVVLSHDVRTQTVFLYHTSVKYSLRCYFLCFLVCLCYALVVTPNRLNQYKFSTLHRLYLWEHRWILVLLLIFVDWYKTFK